LVVHGYGMMIMHLTVWWICVGSSLPVLLHGCIVCGCSLLRWSSIWLMGADGRSSRGQQGNGDSAA